MPIVRTRFAPSPTGYMHIGGMRTALFNWLWARHWGGQFILRIDDTDQARNQEAALGPILRAFRWLGLAWDEGAEVGGPYAPYYQSQRGELYRAAAAKLEATGLAYRDFATKEEIDADRKQAEREKRPYINIRRSLELSAGQQADFEAQGRPWVLRFLIPRERKVMLDDHIRGHVEWDAALLPDPVIQRADGSPLYNFATVVDDAQMQITHVVRAEEHLSNTPIQILLHQALGNSLPEFAHVPYVAAPGSKEKLSKRKIDQYRKNPQFQKMFEKGDEVFPQLGLASSTSLDPVMVEYYERIGYLPAAVLNGLGRIGWSLDDSTEIMSLATMVEHFTLDRVVQSAASFDPDKLYSFQGHWMKELPLEQKLAGCLPFLIEAHLISQPVSSQTRDFVSSIIENGTGRAACKSLQRHPRGQIFFSRRDRVRRKSLRQTSAEARRSSTPGRISPTARRGRAVHGPGHRDGPASLLPGNRRADRNADPRPPPEHHRPGRRPRSLRLSGPVVQGKVAGPDRRGAARQRLRLEWGSSGKRQGAVNFAP